MPALSQPPDGSLPRLQGERACYAQLQPVSATDLTFGALITSSDKVCHPEDLAESSFSGYPAAAVSSSSSCPSPYPLHPPASFQQLPCSPQYEKTSPESRSPASVDEEEFTSIQEAPQSRMTGNRRDDDDLSVMFDITDLGFLDDYKGQEDSTCSTWPPFSSSTTTHPTGPYSTPYSPSSQQHHQHHLSPSSSSSSSQYMYTHIPITPLTSTITTTLNNNNSNNDTLPSADTKPRFAHHHNHHHQHPTTTPSLHSWSLQYYDTPFLPLTERVVSSLPPTPSPSPRHHLPESKIGEDIHHHHHRHHTHHPLYRSYLPSPHQYLHPHVAMTSSMSVMTKEGGEEEEGHDAEEDDPVYKPYCESRRGAKKNLLWKFLLTVLDSRSDLAQWTDLKEGVFKFLDTGSISKLWGHKKHKNDMTFEKLSRGIRHYYKRGLMERMSNTRLVYKFNWDKVPKKFRKI